MTVQETAKTVGDEFRLRLRAAFWIAVMAYLALVVGFAWNPTPLAQGLAAAGILAACCHAVFFYGWKDALALMAICVITTFAIENIAAARQDSPSGTIISRSDPTCRMSGSSP